MEYKFDQPITRSELADAYGISKEAFRDKLKRENLDIPSGSIYPKDISLIFEKLGYPSNGGKNTPNDNSNSEENPK